MSRQGAATPGVYQIAKSSNVADGALGRNLHFAAVERVQPHRVLARLVRFFDKFFFVQFFFVLQFVLLRGNLTRPPGEAGAAPKERS